MERRPFSVYIHSTPKTEVLSSSLEYADKQPDPHSSISIFVKERRLNSQPRGLRAAVLRRRLKTQNKK